jgi:hypothetical protein
MKQIAQIAILLLVISLQAKSQEYHLMFQTGMGNYSMSDLKGLNQINLKRLPFEAKIVSDFPPYWTYRPAVLVKFNRISLGASLSYQSTGSRISVKDYSGEYRFDMNVNAISPGIYAEVEVLKIKTLQLSFYTSVEKSTTRLSTDEYFNVADSLLINEKFDLKAKSFSLEPGICVSYPILFFTFGMNVGYSLPLGTKAFYLSDSKDKTMSNTETGKPVNPKWEGLRGWLTFNYTINKKVRKQL